MNTSSLTPLLWLVGVIALIPLVLWMIKRSPMGAQFASGPVRPVGTLPLSNGQRLVTIEVGHGEERLWLVLGVTPHSITTLHTMVPQASAPAVAPGAAANPQATFAQLLGRLQGRGPDAR
jgi:flagellar protein FliO/FliZ